MASVEVDFAGDSTGFSAGCFERWCEIKHNGVKPIRTWQKLHLMCGVKTNIVSHVVIEDKDAADTKQLPEMVKTGADVQDA